MSRHDAARLLNRWRNGYAGFLAFIADTGLQVLEGGRWKPMTLFHWQEEALRGFFGAEPTPRTLVFVLPRRSGKTTLAAAVVVWRAFTGPNQVIGCGANSREQATNVPFKMLSGMVLRSRLLLDLAGGPGNVQTDRIVLPHVGSEIRALPTSPAAVYGIGFSAAWISELAAGGPELFDVVASGVLDRSDGLVIVDSTPSGPNHLLQRLYSSAVNQGGEDETVYCYHRTWKPGEPPLNPNLRERDLIARSRQMLPDQFAREHRGEWCGSSSALFSPELLEASTIPEPPTLERLRAKYDMVSLSLGFDLALTMSKHGDQSFAVLIAMANNPLVPADIEQELTAHAAMMTKMGYPLDAIGLELKRAELSAHRGPRFTRLQRSDFYVLRVAEVADETAKKQELAVIHELFGKYPDHISCEAYQSAGIADHIRRMGRWVEIIHASQREQAEAFTRWHTIMTDGRFFIPATEPFAELRRQMLIFEVDSTGAIPTFGVRGAKRGTNRDDTVYATTWALYGTRNLSSCQPCIG